MPTTAHDDLLLRNGSFYYGSGSPPIVGDVAVKRRLHVFVNVTQVLRGGEHAGAKPGQVVRRSGWKKGAT
jgi:hypothetical protein